MSSPPRSVPRATLPNCGCDCHPFALRQLTVNVRGYVNGLSRIGRCSTQAAGVCVVSPDLTCGFLTGDIFVTVKSISSLSDGSVGFPKTLPLFHHEYIMANNRIVHFEIPANQPEALTKFYSDLFGWKFQKAPIPGPQYWLCDTGSDGPGINGAVMQRQHAQQPWMNYVDVASIDAATEKATKLGAKVALPKTPVPGVGAVAAIVDPQGNVCGLWEQATQ